MRHSNTPGVVVNNVGMEAIKKVLVTPLPPSSVAQHRPHGVHVQLLNELQ